jgi:hypothetical protein
MSAASTFVTYLWHYLLARAIYDDLVRPLVRGHGSGAVVLICVVVVAFVLGRVTRRRM